MIRPTSVKQYLDALPAERREALEAVRKTIAANLDPAFEEGIQYGMIAWYVPHSVFPDGYHCDPREPVPFASIASQKNHMALYLFCLYTDEAEVERFTREWKATGKKLDMGKSCVRFERLEDVPLDVLGRVIGRVKAKTFLASYVAARDAAPAGRAARKQAAKKAGKKASRKRVGKARVAKQAGARTSNEKAWKKAPGKAAEKASRKGSSREAAGARRARQERRP